MGIHYMMVKNSFLISDINTSENKMMMNESDNQQGSKQKR
jgi:hypothetical protein